MKRMPTLSKFEEISSNITNHHGVAVATTNRNKIIFGLGKKCNMYKTNILKNLNLTWRYTKLKKTTTTITVGQDGVGALKADVKLSNQKLNYTINNSLNKLFLFIIKWNEIHWTLSGDNNW
jgi:hypothetical protein